MLFNVAHSVPSLSIRFALKLIRGPSASKSLVLDDLVSLIHQHIMKTRNEERFASLIKDHGFDDSELSNDDALSNIADNTCEACQRLPGGFEENKENKYIQEKTNAEWLNSYVKDRNNRFNELLVVNLDFERRREREQDAITSLLRFISLGVKKVRHLYWEKQEKHITNITEATGEQLSADIDPFLSFDTIEIQVGALELAEKKKLFAFLKEELDTNKTIPASERPIDENLRLLLIECINLSFLFFKFSLPILKFLYDKFMTDSTILINKTNTNRFLTWFIANLRSLLSKFDPPSSDLETLFQDRGQSLNLNNGSFWPFFRIQRAQQSENKSNLISDSGSYERLSLFKAAVKFADQL